MQNSEMKIFSGEHCETTATGTLLANLDIELSEPMLFGLGEGLGYGVINFGKIPFPFLGGRTKTFNITQKICENLGLELEIKRTTSIKKAWNNIKESLDNNIPVGLQLDSYYLDYFKNKVHFAGHFVAMVGYDEEYAYLVDTNQQGKLMKATLKNLELARSSKQPMSDKNMSYIIRKTKDDINLEEVINRAISNNATEFLNPPIRNFGYKGIIKTANEIEKWFDNSSNVKEDFTTTAMLMERGGTGGSIFRNVYTEFLTEAYSIVERDEIINAKDLFSESALMWKEVAELIEKTGIEETKSYLPKISDLLHQICNKEYEAMKMLSKL